MDEDENSEPSAGENLRSALEVTPERKHKSRESLISPKHNNAEDLDEIARRLLHGKFLLSALEFHTELTEIGQEIPRLKEFFSNPGNFEVQSTLEPLISLSKFVLCNQYISSKEFLSSKTMSKAQHLHHACMMMSSR